MIFKKQGGRPQQLEQQQKMHEEKGDKNVGSVMEPPTQLLPTIVRVRALSVVYGFLAIPRSHECLFAAQMPDVILGVHQVAGHQTPP
jgi:hypothetical protein